MGKRPLGAQLSRMLAERGVEVIFGIPGVHNIELYRGLEQSGLRHVLARHEQGAGFMADGYARATGRPGVAYVITGPGLTNIMTPMGQAYSDSVPMLVVSTCLDETAAMRGQLHQMRDQRAAAGTVCDWSEEARTPRAAYALIDRALDEFDCDRPRPKHIQVPIALAGTPVAEFPARSDAPHPGRDNPVMRQAVAAEINAAKRPLFIFGGGASGLRNDGTVMELLARTGAASFCSYAGRGIVPPDNPLFFGSYLGRPDSANVIASADLVVVVGSELSESDLWRTALGHDGTLLRIDLDPEVLGDRHRADIKVHADAGTFLFNMLPEIVDKDGHSGWTAEEVTAARARWRAETDAERPGIVPIAEALQEVLPKDAVIFSDMTQFAYVSKEIWDMAPEGQWHHPTGFGTLGYALPAAIGGKVGLPDRPVLAIAGDYGFQYTLQELGTAKEEGMCLPVLLWDNGLLKEIETSMAQSQIAPVAIEAWNPDFGLLAQAYGYGYERPDNLEALQTAVKAALAGDGPVLIHMTPAMLG
jgi:acetolactate synthase-1/2/3 large subunit/5-guanidino-2-oxopentanoate decarboxylase